MEGDIAPTLRSTLGALPCSAGRTIPARTNPATGENQLFPSCFRSLRDRYISAGRLRNTSRRPTTAEGLGCYAGPQTVDAYRAEGTILMIDVGFLGLESWDARWAGHLGCRASPFF